VVAFDPDTDEGVGLLTVGGSGAGGWTVGVANVRHDMKGQGVGKTMMSVMNYRLGPGVRAAHSDALSPEGYRFASTSGGKVPTNGPTTSSWGDQTEAETSENIRGWRNGLGRRVYDAPSVALAAAAGDEVPEAKYLAHRPVSPQRMEEFSEPQMFRKVRGAEVPIKKAMP
jgi:hypothetical protein